MSETFIEAALVSRDLALRVDEAADGGLNYSRSKGAFGSNRRALTNSVLAACELTTPDLNREFAPFFARFADSKSPLAGRGLAIKL